MTTPTSRQGAILIHHQYRERETGPWITHKVVPYGPTYDLDKAREFAESIATSARRQRWLLGRWGTTAQPRQDTWVITDGNHRRSIVEVVRLTHTKSHLRDGRNTVRQWLQDRPINSEQRRRA